MVSTMLCIKDPRRGQLHKISFYYCMLIMMDFSLRKRLSCEQNRYSEVVFWQQFSSISRLSRLSQYLIDSARYPSLTNSSLRYSNTHTLRRTALGLLKMRCADRKAFSEAVSTPGYIRTID
jgi:hypothetical protein